MYTYIGEDWEYHNLYPDMTYKLEHGKQYNIQIQSNAQQVIINGVAMNTEPTELRVFLPPQYAAWIPYNPKCFAAHWKEVQMCTLIFIVVIVTTTPVFYALWVAMCRKIRDRVALARWMKIYMQNTRI